MFQKYNEMDDFYKRTNYHMHTTYTDGKNTPEEMLQKCIECGYTSIAFTDHARSNSDYLPHYFKEINELSCRYNFKILKGIEARISDFDGTISYPKHEKSNIDIIIASVHRISINDKLFYIKEFTPKTAFEIETYLALNAIKKRECNVIGHSGGMSIEAFDEFPLENFEQIIKLCAENDTAFEINYRYHKNFIHKLMPLLKKYNPYVTFGTDSHDKESLK